MGKNRGNRNRKKLSYEQLQQDRYLHRGLQKEFWPVSLTRGIYLDWYRWNAYLNKPAQKQQIERLVLDKLPCGATEAWIR